MDLAQPRPESRVQRAIHLGMQVDRLAHATGEVDERVVHPATFERRVAAVALGERLQARQQGSRCLRKAVNLFSKEVEGSKAVRQ